MALHLKSTKSFKILIGFSALLISTMAAIFSVTGIATLFSGYFLTVAFMMGVLEFSKIVVASFLARYWTVVNRVLRGYFIIAIIILILITSGGIFGYLSDAYQQTKGDYTIVEKQSLILESKKNMFSERKERLQNDRQLELKAKNSNQTRADSLSSRGQSITRTRDDIIQNDIRIATIEKQITAAEDSIGIYDLKIVELEAQNIKGELGPLKYIAGIFDTDMDTVVKYLILSLIFVFDPLAVLLFVALNIIFRKEHGIYKEDDKFQEEPFQGGEQSIVPVNIENTPIIEQKIEASDDEVKKNFNIKSIEKDLPVVKQEEIVDTAEFPKIDVSEKFVNELIDNFEHENGISHKSDEQEKEHEFYYGKEQKKLKEVEENKPQSMIIERKSANYHP